VGVRQQAEALLGADVRRAVRIWGGYAPSATFRLSMSNGQRVVFKGISNLPAARMRRAGFSKAEIERQSVFQRRILADEERVYRELGSRLLPWAPAFYGSFQVEDWLVLLLEDVGPAQVPPWTADLARAALIDYAAFHASSLGRADAPEWVPRDRHHRFARAWQRLATAPGGIDDLSQLTGEQADQARAWLDRHLLVLDGAAQQLSQAPEPHALLHFDTRSDNLRIQSGGRLRLFDWPYVAVGPHEFDVAAFVQSITTEGGPEPEACMAWYGSGVTVREGTLRASIAAIAGYFAESAWQPPIPGVPRVRSIQRRQLRTSLAWCARTLELEAPSWLASVPD
jgi:Phosphotransferase enzyme family